MTRAPDWSKGEFAILVSSPDLDDDTTAKEIETRTMGAVGVVREGICLYHSGRDTQHILSRMMIEFLAARAGHLFCARCTAQF